MNNLQSTLARPRRTALSVATPSGLAVAYAGQFWLTLLGGATGGQLSAGELVRSWLWAGTVDLPVSVLALWAAVLVWRRATRAARPALTHRLDILTLASCLALAGAVAVAFGGALLRAALGLTSPIGAAQPAAWSTDFAVALVGALPIAVIVSGWLLQDACRPRPLRRVRGRQLLAAGAAMTMAMTMAGTPALASGGSDGGGGGAAGLPVPTATDPGQPCPAGSPQKSFAISAIDVDMPVNRFGDHDPAGKMYVLTHVSNDQTAAGGQDTGLLSAVRAQEANRRVSVGLAGDDPIQPLAVRANEGDCVAIHFTNSSTTGSYGIHIDGLSFKAGSSGDAVGLNPSSNVAPGASTTYTYYVPRDVNVEGAHYLHPGPGQRDAVGHGLFGSLVVEPSGSTYWDNQKPNTALFTGWEGIITPPTAPSFRENVQDYHELGNDNTQLLDSNNQPLPQVDPLTDSYRPGSRLINYRTEPFMNRLRGPNNSSIQEALGYSTYTFADPATPMPRSYLGDPMKFRIMHAGSEMFHVFHLHGGGIRWRFNPHADATYDYADTGLRKNPVVMSASTRLDSQSIGPGESYDLEIEGGSGGVQQVAGEFLFHCHIAKHYVSGMWSFWRVFNTSQPDLAPLADRNPNLPPILASVSSKDLIGKNFNGTTITAANLAGWIRPQLPPPGTRTSQNDASVWDWTTNPADPAVYLGEPEDTTPWVDDNLIDANHPTAYPGDVWVGNRPQIRFNPVNGRIAWPLTRTHVGMRPPFSGNGHTGAPYLGETANKAADTSVAIDPYANRPDGLCPATAPVRHYNITAIELPIRITKKAVDPNGMIYALADDIPAIRAGTKLAEPLAIRANVGDCIAATLTSEQVSGAFPKVNIHIHHVQFDTEASDGVITGGEYEQSVRPYKTADVQLATDTAVGAGSLMVTKVNPQLRPGVWIAVGEGTGQIEVRQIKTVHNTSITMTWPLAAAHRAGSWTGTEFVQYRWYADTALDNIFFHDHVDAIHTWGHGLVGQLIVEPPGATWTDPTTGKPVSSGALVDVHTTNPLVPSLVNGSFREFALWTIDENPVTDSTINLKAEPWADRPSDPANRFSSYTGGDPITPTLRAYPGDPVVIRAVDANPEGADGLHLDGHQFVDENRYPLNPDGTPEASPHNGQEIGISERFTDVLLGGAGGWEHRPGDYLYMNTLDRRFRQGAWGLIRVLPKQLGDLQPLPDNNTIPTGGQLPAVTGGPAPAPASIPSPCPAGATPHTVEVAAVDVPSQTNLGTNQIRAAFVPLADAAAVRGNAKVPEPLVLHVAQGECLRVSLSNLRNGDRVSFHLDGLTRTAESSGINVGFNPDNTVAAGQRRDYLFYADKAQHVAALINDYGADDTGKIGLYGTVNVAPTGASFTNPVTGAPTDTGSQVDVHVPGRPGYRDFTAIVSDDDPRIGQSTMPYPTDVSGPSLVNYQSVLNQNRAMDSNMFSSYAHGDPNTPVFRAYAGDPTTVHLVVAPGSEQIHTLTLGGMSFSLDSNVHQSQAVQTRQIAPYVVLDAQIMGGAGGQGTEDTTVTPAVADFYYGDQRRPFTNAGMWGLIRTLSDPRCPIRALDGRNCTPIN